MIQITQIKEVLSRICDVMIREKEALTEIDSRLGDGDMGISMEKGAVAVKRVLENGQENSISNLLLTAASAFNRAAPSTLGTLISFSIMSIAKVTKGRAKQGDKTILDAFIPFADTLQSVYDGKKDVQAALEAALEAAEKGMESTKGMLAKTGRASWLDGRNK